MVIRNLSKNLNGRSQLSPLMRQTPPGPALSVRLRVIDVCLMESQIKGLYKERQGLACVAGGISWRAVVFWRQGRGKVGNNQRTGIALINIGTYIGTV